MSGSSRFLGIDFSGAAGPWRASCSRPTVWIATLEGFRLADLRSVQDVDGDGEPFENLVALLKEGRYRAAAIDAPFSIPKNHLPPGGHAELLKAVAKMPAGDGKPFPGGDSLFAFAQKVHAYDPNRKVMRETERTCGAVARSTLWHGKDGDGRSGRPGTPFTAACLCLLSRAGRPIWPWKDAPGMLVEAFPMAQLKHWGLPWHKYGPAEKDAGVAEIAERRARRKAIIEGIRTRTQFDISPSLSRLMIDQPDALDAFIAAFGGRAAANRDLRMTPVMSVARLEGAIAVHA
jgi:hypothetical protein